MCPQCIFVCAPQQGSDSWVNTDPAPRETQPHRRDSARTSWVCPVQGLSQSLSPSGHLSLFNCHPTETGGTIGIMAANMLLDTDGFSSSLTTLNAFYLILTKTLWGRYHYSHFAACASWSLGLSHAAAGAVLPLEPKLSPLQPGCALLLGFNLHHPKPLQL